MGRIDQLTGFSGRRLGLWLLASALLWIGFREQSLAFKLAAVGVFALSYAPADWRAGRYAKQVYDARKACLQAIIVANFQFRRGMAAHRDALRSLSTPDSMTALRRGLLSTDIAPETNETGPDRINAIVSHHRDVAQLLADRQARPVSPEEDEYLTEAGKWWSAALARVDECHKSSERLMSAAMARLSELHPPRALADAHRDLVAGLEAEYTAWATYHQAFLSLDVEAAVAAHNQLAPARATIRKATNVIMAKHPRARTARPANPAGRDTADSEA